MDLNHHVLTQATQKEILLKDLRATKISQAKLLVEI